MAKKQFCQGDLMFQFVSDKTGMPTMQTSEARPIPIKIPLNDAGRLIIERGEKTGHAHTVTTQDTLLYQLFGREYLVVESNSTQVTHDEHEPLTLPKGTWQVIEK